MTTQLLKSRFLKAIETDDTGFKDAPGILFNPYRLLIMKILVRHGHADFGDMKRDLQVTDGNLASHLRALAKMGYVEAHKEIVGNKPRTTFALTKNGMKAFEKLLEELKEVIE